MNNTYKAVMLVILMNILLMTLMSGSTNPIEQNNENVGDQMLNDELYETTPDLQNEYASNPTTSWSMVRGIKTLYGSMVGIGLEGYDGVEKTVLQVMSTFLNLINIFIGIMLFKTLRGTQ